MTELTRLDRVKNVLQQKREEDVLYVLEKLKLKHRVVSRDNQLLLIGTRDDDQERFNLIVKDGLVVEIYFG